MTTKIFKFSLKIILCFTLLFSFENVYAASKWIVAAEPFVLANNKDNEVLKSCSVVLPSLILEFLNENVQRRLASQEILDRKLYDFQKERISLFLQLSNEVKSRDVIFLNDYSKSKLKRKLKESDKKIKDIEEKIAQNLKEVEYLGTQIPVGAFTHAQKLEKASFPIEIIVSQICISAKDVQL